MGQAFNPPPNWPRSPEGWTPPHGPDPGWGWQPPVDGTGGPVPHPGAPQAGSPKRRFFRSLRFWTLLTSAAVVVVALAMGGKFGALELSPDNGLRVEFDNSASGAEGVSREEVDQAQSDLTQRVTALEERAQSAPASTEEAGVDISGTWQGSNGFTYVIEQYGTELVVQEEAAGYGITAVGYGYVDGSGSVYVEYLAYDGSAGYGEFSSDGDFLSGTLFNTTYGVTAAVDMYRVA